MNGKIIELLKTKKRDGNGGSEYPRIAVTRYE
jgi:hypothetical protein